MELICNSTSRSSLMVITDEIAFSTKITHLNILIDDVNDNSPVISKPSTSSSKIGYPEESLIERLMPQQLIKIEAFDLDDGINAKIKFSATPTTHFNIDPENGVIYPEEKLIDSTTIITVSAVDLDGDVNGRKDQVVLEVIKLTINDIIQMTVNLVSKDVDDFMESFSDEVGLDLRTISYAAIPSDHVANARQLKEFDEGRMLLYVYGFSANGDVVKAQALIDILKELDTPQITYSLISINDENNNDDDNKPSNAGWIAAVSILASLLFLIIIAIPMVYFKWFRKDNPRSFETSSARDLNDNFDAEPGQSTPIQNTENSECQETTEVVVESDDNVEAVNGKINLIKFHILIIFFT